MHAAALLNLLATLLLLSADQVLGADNENEFVLNVFSDIGPYVEIYSNPSILFLG